MDSIKILQKFYRPDTRAYNILLTHSRCVTRKALEMARLHPELHPDLDFISQAAMLHDIGIYLCDAPDIDCHGSEPYIRHGILGAALLRELDLPRHALVCERHTGTGITVSDIRDQHLPLPLRDFSPVSVEEQLICYADKFFSKSRPDYERTPQQVLLSLKKFGSRATERILEWQTRFL
ncbi:MAG: HDIG domain-containing protein [Paludibacteraceae bacterium]|nr:HDIG domain-containing protein [Paludibacteraceae bacterium]MCR5298102.1 HDIG domain-containing protein [Paludibacteraceae bacterium]